MDTRKNEVRIHISLIGGELHETRQPRYHQGATLAWSRPATALSSSDVRSLMIGKKVSVRGGGGGGGAAAHAGGAWEGAVPTRSR